MIKSSNPYYLLQQLFDSIKNSTTHESALNTLDLIQVLILVNVDNGVKYLKQINWHESLDRFSSIIPKTSIDQSLFTRIYSTISKIVEYCLPFDGQVNINELDSWLIKMINDVESSFLIVFKKLLDNYDNDELHIR